MNPTSSCPDEPLVCAISEVAQAIQEGPSFFDWLALGVIPLVSALASVAVLFFSVRTARAAEHQAERTEAARLKAELDRNEDERRRRINVALSAFLGELANNLEEHREYDRVTSMGRLAGDPEPVLPSASPLLVRIGVAKMDARPSELEFLQDLATVVIPPDDLPNEHVRLRLRLLPDLVADWARESGEAKGLAAQAVKQLSHAKSGPAIRAVQQQYRDKVGDC